MAYIFVVIGVILVLVAAWFLVGCSRVPSKYVIDIDKLMDAEPEMCNQQLMEIAGCRLSHTDYREEGVDDAKGMTGDVATMTYEKVDGIVNESNITVSHSLLILTEQNFVKSFRGLIWSKSIVPLFPRCDK